MSSKEKKPFIKYDTSHLGISKHIPCEPGMDLNKEFTLSFDKKLHSQMGKLLPFSPGSLATNCFDWFIHLSLAPGKQVELVESALVKYTELIEYSFSNMYGKPAEPCVSSTPQDKRFEDSAWQKWPYNIFQQTFLSTEQWWIEATSSIRGVTQHHSEVLPFLVRQYLDASAPLNFPLTNPLVVDATIKQNGVNFINGLNNFHEDIKNAIEKKPPVGAEKFKVGETVAITKGKVVYKNQLIELIQYSPLTENVYAEPILIVPAWIMKYYILDLSPNNSLVKFLVEKGHTVFMVSWKNPDSNDRNLGFEDYMNLGVIDSVDAISKIIPNKKIQAVGYCLGGTILAVAAAYMAKHNDNRLKSLTLFATQVDYEEAGELLFFIDESQIAFLEDIMSDKGYLDSSRMAGTFSMIRSYDLIWSKLVETYMLGVRRPLNDLMSWNADATRMPYRMHSEYLRSLFLNNDLTGGRFKVNGQAIALNDISVPIFCVSTQRDHVAPWHSVYKIINNTDTEITFLLTSGGHNAGIISEPGHPHRSYQVSMHKKNDKHPSPLEWAESTPSQEGSWWIVWQEWLVSKSGDKGPTPPMGKAISDAPGEYVLMK